jgi:hypothetical protein
MPILLMITILMKMRNMSDFWMKTKSIRRQIGELCVEALLTLLILIMLAL